MKSFVVKKKNVCNWEDFSLERLNSIYFSPSDPYQTLGPISSRLANPGKKWKTTCWKKNKTQLPSQKWDLYTVCFGAIKETKAATHEPAKQIALSLLESKKRLWLPASTKWLFALLFPHRRPSAQLVQEPNRQTKSLQAAWPQRSQACG